jgi:hypothetical protein
MNKTIITILGTIVIVLAVQSATAYQLWLVYKKLNPTIWVADSAPQELTGDMK